MEKTIKENKMGTEKVFKLLASMSIPAIFSMLIQSLYNVVDSIFVAQIDGNALTAVSLAFPVQNLMIAVGVGTAIGINSLISRRLGERRQADANAAATHGLILAACSALLFTVLGLLFTRPFFEAFTSTASVISYGCDYTYIVTTMSFGLFISICLEKTLQATGNMIYPMLIQLTGAITNIILDPILIFGLFGAPKLGVQGAAIATVAGQILGMLLAVAFVIFRDHDIHISFKKFRFSLRTVKEIYAVGVPSIIMQSIASLVVVVLNAILIVFSEAAVAVLGVYFKLQSFVFMPVFGLTQGSLPIMGFNYGAGSKKRLLKTLKYGCIVAGAIMAAGCLIFNLFPEFLLSLFNATPEMLAIGVPALKTISLCFIPAAIDIMLSTLFQAVGCGNKSLIVSVLRQLVITVPAALLFSKISLSLVWYAFPLAEAVSLVVGIMLFIGLKRGRINSLKTTLAE